MALIISTISRSFVGILRWKATGLVREVGRISGMVWVLKGNRF